MRLKTLTEIRVGHGFDIHPYSEDPDRSMVLGGVIFDAWKNTFSSGGNVQKKSCILIDFPLENSDATACTTQLERAMSIHLFSLS